MQYVTIPGLPLPASRLILGCGVPTMLAGGDASDMLDSAFEAGINLFDTAENYGLSEESLGRWMAARGNRAHVLVLTKGCHPYGRSRVTPTDIRADIEQSYVRLDTDVIDVYLLHRDDPTAPVGPVMETLHEYVASGRVRVIGASNWEYTRVREANEYAASHGLTPFAIASPNFSLARQVRDPWGGGCVTISGKEHARDRMWYHDNGIRIFAYSSMGRGMFSGKGASSDPDSVRAHMDEGAIKGYDAPENFERLRRAERLAAEKRCTVPQLALAYVLCDPLTMFPIISATKPAHLTSNLAALDISLTNAERAWLDLETDAL